MLSVFDIFKIGVGPSSSHTVGPMIAAVRFVRRLEQAQLLTQVHRLHIELFGSLGATGYGHASDTAVMVGLHGHLPDQVDPDIIPELVARIRTQQQVKLLDRYCIAFNPDTDLIFNFVHTLPQHPNGMRFKAFNAQGQQLMKKEYYSIGGGFVMNCDGLRVNLTPETPVPYPFKTGDDLLRLSQENGLSIAQMMMANELAMRDETTVREGVLRLWQVMQACVQRGCAQQGVLPGGFKVKRRAPELYQRLCHRPEESLRDPLAMLDWVNLYALAVNEENAAGGRVVTAPTNGAAGIIPAVLHYYDRFISPNNSQGIIDFLLTAAAIGILYKENASISGAEVGCQGEVGVACSMAAGALAAVQGGTVAQVENAAEIGMEHNLGMTCDPVGGLVQVPCIERNAMGAIKALNAARLALRGDGQHLVSLDKVILTMKQTGADMKATYKETSQAGLAVNVPAC